MEVLNILVRRCIPLEGFDAAVVFYETLVGQPARLRFEHPDAGLRLAQVATILLIGGTPDKLAAVADTAATFLVDDIEGYRRHLPTVGAEIVRPPRAVPTGRNMLARHPDGWYVEYVQHDRPHPADRLPGSS